MSLARAACPSAVAMPLWAAACGQTASLFVALRIRKEVESRKWKVCKVKSEGLPNFQLYELSAFNGSASSFGLIII